MENQHKKIKGYRDLSQEEIDLMNKIKAHGEVTESLLEELLEMRKETHYALNNSPTRYVNGLCQEQIEESMRSVYIAKQNLQTGQMWFVRAVALPDSF